MKSAFTHLAAIILGSALSAANLACTQPITKRDQSGLIGGSIGAVTGAIVGSAIGHAGAGGIDRRIHRTVGERFDWRSTHG